MPRAPSGSPGRRSRALARHRRHVRGVRGVRPRRGARPARAVRRGAPAPRALAAAPGQPARDPGRGEALPGRTRPRTRGGDGNGWTDTRATRGDAYDAAVRILVTGAAGFIGSNFVHYWLERHPDDSIVALDLLTYAGNRANLEGTEERVPFVQADIADIDLVENVLLRARDRRRRQLRGRVAQQPRGRRSGPVRAHERPRHAAPARGGAQGRDRALPPHLDVRGLRRPPARLGRVVQRGVAVPPAHAVQRVEGGGGPLRARLPRDVRAADDDHELLEQLRAVPVPGEGDPALRHERARRPAAADVLVDAEQARVAARARPLPRDRARPRAAASRARRTTSARASRRRSRRSPTACWS